MNDFKWNWNFLAHSFTNNFNIRNRMKRSSSSTAKENALRHAVSKLSINKQPKNPQLNSFNSNHSLLNQHSAQHTSTETPNPYFEQFYTTFGSNNFAEWSRPTSKQAYRKLGGRPETSKGVRPIEKVAKRWRAGSKDIAFQSQYTPEKTT